MRDRIRTVKVVKMAFLEKMAGLVKPLKVVKLVNMAKMNVNWGNL